MSDLRFERVPITHPDAQALIEAVQAEYVVRYGGQDESPIDPADFEDPLGQFFVAYLDGSPVATGAWRRSSVKALGAEVTAEVKRMYVVPAAQRRGVARRMLGHLEVTAAAEGIEVIVLETGMKQPEAIALYTSSGYEPIPGFGYYCGSELSRCFGRRI
ncbi:Acetyltransferase (GNAT) family protein [Nocardioides alpinus]|uniref:Acetyltransferase (GNAT) family protein n=1 Tax=Nocardioides alpinus TaxID=748909 RepID=A0A1I0W270_9ACTN|nr:GNAT family N-acetyltransferase [Nocardioides alpinus]PKH37630.1 N-acetyltransferase [Nocardioides alpinus]SFA82634.1 Acetyltransferase (GNAT) family protein [Nocardioides alpinus]